MKTNTNYIRKTFKIKIFYSFIEYAFMQVYSLIFQILCGFLLLVGLAISFDYLCNNNFFFNNFLNLEKLVKKFLDFIETDKKKLSQFNNFSNDFELVPEETTINNNNIIDQKNCNKKEWVWLPIFRELYDIFCEFSELLISLLDEYDGDDPEYFVEENKSENSDSNDSKNDSPEAIKRNLHADAAEKRANKKN